MYIKKKKIDSISNSDLDLIWNASQEKHLSVRESMYNLIGELPQWLKPKSARYMFSKMEEIPLGKKINNKNKQKFISTPVFFLHLL